MRHTLLGVFTALIVIVTADAAHADARTHFNKGRQAIGAGDFTTAQTHLNQAVAQSPDWGLARLELGIVEQTLALETAAGLVHLERAAQLLPDNPRAHYHLGRAYQEAERFDDAVHALRLCIAKRGKFRDAPFRLAEALDAAGHADAAVAAYREVLHGEPAHTGALAALGRLYENLQRPGDAEQALKTIADLHPNIAYHHYQLAQFYVRVGDAGKAKQAFARAESVAPTPRRRMRRLR